MSLAELLGEHTAEPIAGGDMCQAFRVRTAGGEFFAKTPNRPDPHMLPLEAAGLRRIAGVVPGLTPDVAAVDAQWLVLSWVPTGSPDAWSAQALGRRLAALHAAPATAFGDGPEQGRIGSLPMRSGRYESWPQMYAQSRLRPLLGSDTPTCAALVEVLADEPDWAGPAEPPSLLHGDLWSGNVLWARDPVLVDPACHIGHRETDLAMLALFGTPQLDHVIAAYDEAYPLADGWRERVGLHQLWPLLVHARLFGGGYGPRAESIAAAYLKS